MKAQVPRLWQYQLAGVSFTRPKGPGEKKLDELCRANGLTWGIVATYHEGKEIRTTVLVGHVFDAGAEKLIENTPTNVWDEVDVALGAVAQSIEDECGQQG